MTEFYMENWDLQAVVRGYSNDAFIFALENPSSVFDPLSIQQEKLLNCPETFITNTSVLHELEDLPRPNHPHLNRLSTQTVITTSLSVPHDVKEPEKLESQQSPYQSTVAAKLRKRKNQNQQNRVVQHVRADGPSSDIWAWRKYGQKLIRGSPYPRSYYKCSSSKGCLARKQVERCYWDPRIFIITYTAEHSHDQPTHRSSLAGTIRSKPSMAKYPEISKPRLPTNSVFSLTTTLVTPTEEDQFWKQDSIKRAEAKVLEDLEGEKIFSPDITLNDEFVQSLEDLEGLLLGKFPI
ncbi:hypothetical protein SLEP1_g32939 [Rubroshorea leprosula]|uniref:WRKY domain-containing protein n=1 Tax=Rubroshorea leprosula TaxID=152421 RepID=A0AAV5KF45_9ROSI|nr:hypothetical protein SLEP1_g32939 [Rubroshorea leprosula]